MTGNLIFLQISNNFKKIMDFLIGFERRRLAGREFSRGRIRAVNESQIPEGS